MKNGKKPIYVLGALVLTVVIIALSGAAWRSHSREKRAMETLVEAKRMLSEEEPLEALSILRRIVPGNPQELLEKRAALEIQAHLNMRNIPRLLHLHDTYPHLFLEDEGAALFACRGLMQAGNKTAFDTLRQGWQGREQDAGAWFALDVDTLLVAGKRDLAIQMLTSKQFEGDVEAIRLTRLALLTAPDNLEEAWGYLEEASVLAPYNSDIHLFRGQILERLGKPASARVEYVAAHLAEPDNPRLRDQLAEFYRRQGNMILALSTWSQGLTTSAPGYLWLKSMFWSRMVQPLERDWSKGPYPEGRLTPLLLYLGQLPDTSLWDEEAFFQVPDRKLFLSSRQELFWLRVVDHLSRGQENQALLLLMRSPFKELSWHPEMEEALMATLRFRKWGAFPREASSHLSADKSSHPLFRQLAAKGSKPSPELAALLQSPEAFSALFLAGGWIEASLRLHRMPEIPESFPGWVPYGLTQAFRYNRGTAEALAFAERQPRTPAMGVLKGELLLAENQINEGLALLSDTAKDNSDAGFRAAWLKAMVLLDQGKIDAAKQAIRQQPRLAKSLPGRELMARIAVAEGKAEEATRLYTAMKKESVEARVWLARQAYFDERWKDARRLTIELAGISPDTLQFRANLAAISRAEEESSP